MPHIPTSNARGGPSSSRRGLVEVNGQEESGHREPDLVEEDGWTVDTFQNQPIKKTDAVMLVMSNMRDRISELIQKVVQGMERARDAAIKVEDANSDDPMVEELENDFIQAITSRDVLQIKLDVINDLHGELRQNKDLLDPLTHYKHEVQKREAEYKKLTLRARLSNNDDYINFRSGLWEIHHEDEPCPPMTTWLPRGDGDNSDDEDFEVGGQTQNYRCPITLLPFEDAMTCLQCKHSYSKKAIIGLLQQSRKTKRPVKCPQTGCNVVVTMANLQENPGLQKRTDEAEKRKRRRAEEEEDDEDDDE